MRERFRKGLKESVPDPDLDEEDYEQVGHGPPSFGAIVVEVSHSSLKGAEGGVLSGWEKMLHEEAGWPEGSKLIVSHDSGTVLASVRTPDETMLVVEFEHDIFKDRLLAHVPAYTPSIFDNGFDPTAPTMMTIETTGFDPKIIKAIQEAIQSGREVQLTIKDRRMFQADTQSETFVAINANRNVIPKIHRKHAFSFKSHIDRNSTMVTKADVGKVAFTESDGSYWMVVEDSFSKANVDWVRCEDPNEGCSSCWNSTADEPAACMSCGRDIPLKR